MPEDTIRIAPPPAVFPEPTPVGLGAPVDLPQVEYTAPKRKRRHQRRLRERRLAEHRASLG